MATAERAVRSERIPKAELKARKQKVVRDSIFEAAINLFAANGFDETTIEEIAVAAGVSRRTFFHYYSTKDDLLAQNVTSFGAALVGAIELCPETSSLLGVVRQSVLLVGTRSVENPRTRKIVDIAQRSVAARKAHASRLLEVEDNVASAFAKRIKCTSPFAIKPRLLAHLTISVLNISVLAWFTAEHLNFTKAVDESFLTLSRLVGEEGDSASGGDTPRAKTAGASVARAKLKK